MLVKIAFDKWACSDGNSRVHPKVKWIDGVLKDLKALGVRDEKSAAFRACGRWGNA
jgi:hypothetical protein